MSQWGWQMRQDLQEMSPSGQMQAQVDCPRASSRAHRATLRQLNPTHSICLTSIGVCMFRCLAIKSTILLLWKQFENKKAKGISETQRTQKRYTEMKGGNKHMKNMNLSVESWVKRQGSWGRQCCLPGSLLQPSTLGIVTYVCIHFLSHLARQKSIWALHSDNRWW